MDSSFDLFMHHQHSIASKQVQVPTESPKFLWSSYIFGAQKEWQVLACNADELNTVSSSYSGFKLATSTFVLSILEFIFIVTSHKHCAFTIIYFRFGNLSLLASYAMLMRHRNLKTAPNKI